MNSPRQHFRLPVLLTRSVTILRVRVLCFGYDCACGERVTVFRLPDGTSTPLQTKVVTCRKGHTRTVAPEQFWTLEEWTETEEESATGT